MWLKGRLFIAFIVAILPGLAIGQFTVEHAAMNNLQKGKWEKAKGQLVRAIRKDSLNPGAHYTLSIYFFSIGNPAFQIDSAYRYTMQAFSDYQYITMRQRERLRKIPLDSIILVKHREQIDSAAFERAKSINAENGYIDFLDRFPQASQRLRAIELRDEVAYLDALKENTYAAFLKYLEKYPESIRRPEARSRYEKLLFESKTKDKKLTSYESFLQDYPQSPYRNEIENQIFEISTASGESTEFEKFLKKYPQSSKTGTARNVLYHLLKDDERSSLRALLNDSIQRLIVLEKYYLVPFLKNDSFGFMNERGEEIIKPGAKQIPDDYLCGNMRDEIIVLENKIIARNGAVIYQGEIKELDKLGYGFLKIQTLDCIKVVHYSGYSIGKDCYQDARMLGKNYLALKKDKQWAVWSLTGRMLVDFNWDDVQRVGDVAIFKKSGKYKLVRLKDVARAADQVSIPFTQEFSEVKSWPNSMFWIKAGHEQGVLNHNLKEWIKLGKHQTEQTFFGAVSQTPLGYKLYEKNSSPSQNFIRVKINQPWVAVQQNGSWQLIDPISKQFQSPAFDSIMFVGPFSVGIKNDSVRVYLSKDNYIELQKSKIQFLPGRDSLFFLLVEEGEKKIVYDAIGEKLFLTSFDKIEYNNEGFFTVFKKDKRGLISRNGKLVVQPEYDALGTVNKGLAQVLKDKRFGLLDIAHRKEIKTEYDKNVVPYNGTKLIASKKGLFGLIRWDNKPITPFEYEEIRYWSDSTALVKKNFNWILYNFVEKKIVMDKIKTFTRVLDTDKERIMIVQQENKYGVISSRKGIIIPPTFTDIINLGSASVPLYFTEKHVEEASIFVVIYYDKNGIQLRKQVYETDDYEKIYCPDN